MSTNKNGMWRSRWAAIGAAIAVTVGAGGLVSVSADSAQSVFVAVSPTRVLDTRIDVGLAGPLVSETARELPVTGTIPVVLPGDVESTGSPVPADATAVVANVTSVGPTAIGFVSVRPGGATGAPSTSNINIERPGGVVPNSVTVEIGSNGNINLYYFGAAAGATTELLVDIVGYYVEGQGTPGPKGDTGDPGPKGDPGPAGLSYVDTFESGATTALGTTSPPAAPANYFFSANLQAGRYFATGDLTIKNEDEAKVGMAICSFFADDVEIGAVSLASMPTSAADDSFAVFPVAASFEVPASGVVEFGQRCYSEGDSTDLVYWFANLTLFKVG